MLRCRIATPTATRLVTRRSTSHFALAALLLATARAHADEPPPPPATSTDAAKREGTPSTPDAEPAAVAADAPKRETSLTPVPAEAPPIGRAIKFTADPVGDGALIAISLTFGLLTNAILSTDEIRPQQISPTFDSSRLLGIDRGAIRQSPSSTADTLSNVGLWGAIGYAAVDTVLDGFREGRSAALVDGIMYAEAVFMTQGLTNVAKIAFRRPRPRAYIARDEYLRGGGDPNTYDNSSIDSSLSFVSGHASQTAAVSAAATYIAFSRSPNTPRPWLTLVAGTLVTSFVSYNRVRAGAHFPTDVIAGAVMGAGVGALVVHLHRDDTVKQRPVWIGVAPVLDGGGVMMASGRF